MEFIKIKKTMTSNGAYWDDGLYHISEEKLTIPDWLLKEAITEDFEAKGVGTVKRVTVGSNSWLVITEDQGDTI